MATGGWLVKMKRSPERG